MIFEIGLNNFLIFEPTGGSGANRLQEAMFSCSGKPAGAAMMEAP